MNGYVCMYPLVKYRYGTSFVHVADLDYTYLFKGARPHPTGNTDSKDTPSGQLILSNNRLDLGVG